MLSPNDKNIRIRSIYFNEDDKEIRAYIQYRTASNRWTQSKCIVESFRFNPQGYEEIKQACAQKMERVESSSACPLPVIAYQSR